MIITDGTHLVSTVSAAELHSFARALGLRREWFQPGRHPHYDLTTAWALRRAMRAGAVRVTAKQLVQQAWWAK